jgi:hypothetical protein
MRIFTTVIAAVIIAATSISFAENPPFSIEVEQVNIPGAPAIQSFAFAQSGGKWLFIGGRTNGLHGFTTITSFPKEFSNKTIYVVDPSSGQTWSRSIFADLPFWVADQLRSTNMQYIQVGNKLYFAGGYGYDSTANALISFPLLKVIDVSETINAIISGNSIAPHIRELNDARLQMTGGELVNLGEYFYLLGGHKFMGPYRRNVNNQTYTNRIKKFKINDNGFNVGISDYSEAIDTVEYHRRDMNVVPAVKPDGIGQYVILYGGVFKKNIDLPYLNPIYIDSSSIAVDYSYEQQMSQYTCAYMSVFNSRDGGMHTTMFAGMSLNSYNELTNTLEYDSLVPFINDITTISRKQDGTTSESISSTRFNALVGSNAKFIINPSIPKYSNNVIKLSELNGRTFVGYMFGGIKGQIPNGGPSTPSDLIYKVYITPDAPLPVELSSFYSTVTDRNVSLRWVTSSEENNFGFEVERISSTEISAGQWTNCGFVSGTGNSMTPVEYSFEDKDLNSGRYSYRLKQVDFNGNLEYHSLSGDVVIGTPVEFRLSQNYPNPFNPSTKISFDIPVDGTVSLIIYDSRGAEAGTLVNESVPAGYYSAEFNAGKNNQLSSGAYYAVLNLIPAGGAKVMSSTIKMIMLK